MPHEDLLISIALDAWKFVHSTARLAAKLDASDQTRLTSQARFFLRRLDDVLAEAGLKLVSLEGQLFEPGMAATPLNMEEFPDADVLVVDQMLEPVVMGANGVVRMGTALLRRGP